MKNALAEKYNREELEAMLQQEHGKDAQLVWEGEKKEYAVNFEENAEGTDEEEKQIDISQYDKV